MKKSKAFRPGGSRRASSTKRRSRHLPVEHPPNAQRVGVLQRVGQRTVGKSLIADQASEPENRMAAHRRGASVRRGRIGAAVHHGMRDLDARRKSIEHETANFVFENRDQVRKIAQILFCAMNRGGQVAFEAAGNRQNLVPAGVLHEQRSGAKISASRSEPRNDAASVSKSAELTTNPAAGGPSATSL